MALRNGRAQKPPHNEFRENPRPEWFYQVPMRKGGGCERIKFRITAAVAGDSSDPCIDGSNDDFTDTIKLTVTIIGRICKGNTVKLGDAAYVYDDDGCLIGDEALEDLIGRTGWATAFVTGESEEEALCCHWSLDGLCCPPEA